MKFLSQTAFALLLLLVVPAFTFAQADSKAEAKQSEPAKTESKSESEPVQESDAPDKSTEAKPAAVGDSSDKLLLMITVFALAVFVGVEIITKIPPTLHTPLMSGSNAISGITLIGALLATGAGDGGFATFLGFLAVVLATVNVVGGFFVTHRMLEMFRKKK